MADDFSSTLTKDVGGIPVWAIGTGVAAVVVGAAWFFNRDSGGTMLQTVYSPDDMQPEPSDPTNADWGLPEGPLGDWLRDNPGYAGYPGVGLPIRGLPAPITNAQWARLAQDYLMSKGDDPGLISSAFTKWLSRQSLTTAETAVINMARRIFGAPPEGDLTPNPSPTPKPTPTGPQPAAGSTRGYGWVQVKSGDSVTSIAKASKITPATLWAYNGMKLSRLTPGEFLKVRYFSNPISGYQGR